MVARVEGEPSDVLGGLAADEAQPAADRLGVGPGVDQAPHPGEVGGGERADGGAAEPVVEPVQAGQAAAEIGHGVRADAGRVVGGGRRCPDPGHAEGDAARGGQHGSAVHGVGPFTQLGDGVQHGYGGGERVAAVFRDLEPGLLQWHAQHRF
ncbi:hypothetical protein [Streptomyces sp. NBC_00454]|uniref:hypothetical protein n=1 Tax=Streptomyces sp. NBC_00454 TaxID=2975747 RepID=UPI00352DA5FB